MLAAMSSPRLVALSVVGFVFACGPALNQTVETCAAGRTLVDGVCVSENVADYVACVRAQGAQLSSDKAQKLALDASTLGLKAGGAGEISESLQKKYSASDATMLAIVQACSTTARGAGTVDKALVARWAFDEASGTAVADASGHGNTGVVQGNPVWVAGRIGGGLKLDGAVDVLVDDSASQHAPRAITITGWFLLTQKSVGQPWRTIVLKSNPKGPNFYGCVDGEKDPCDEREYTVALNSDERYLSVDAVTEDRYQNGGHTWCNSPAGSIQYGKWHHFGAVIAPKNRAIRVFLDGALIVTCPLSEAGLRRTNHPMHLGTSMTGMLDELRIYAAELSDADIAGLARAE
jgi:hypothetical protein